MGGSGEWDRRASRESEGTVARCTWRGPIVGSDEAAGASWTVCSVPGDVVCIARSDDETEVPLPRSIADATDVPLLYYIHAMNRARNLVLYRDPSSWELEVQNVITHRRHARQPNIMVGDACFDDFDNLYLIDRTEDSILITYPDGTPYIHEGILAEQPGVFEAPADGLPFWHRHLQLGFMTPFKSRFAVGGRSLGRIDIYENTGSLVASYRTLVGPEGIIDLAGVRIESGRFDAKGRLWTFGDSIMAIGADGQVFYSESLFAFRTADFFPVDFVGVDGLGRLWFRNVGNFAAFDVCV